MVLELVITSFSYKGKKKRIAVCARSTAPLYGILRAIFLLDHTELCHTAEAVSPALTLAIVTAGTRFIHQIWMKV